MGLGWPVSDSINAGVHDPPFVLAATAVGPRRGTTKSKGDVACEGVVVGRWVALSRPLNHPNI